MLPVDSALFGTAASTQPVSVELWVNSVLVQTSLLGTVSLAAEPTKTTPSAVGVYFAIPTYSAVPGDMISVPMWAQTGSPTMTMGSWGVSLVYDSLLLTFNSVDHPLYTTVLTSQIVTNALNITGSGGAGIISGWFLAATLYFTVNVAAAGQTVSISMPAILTNAMTNSIPVTYNNNFAGKFSDSRLGTFSFTSGQLTVSNPTIAGIYAYSMKSSFVNTWALDGTVSADDMTVVATYDTGRPYPAYSDMTVMPSSCASSNNGVFSASTTPSGCAVTLAANTGGSSVAITASYMGFSCALAYRAYYFMAYQLNATRVSLRKLGCDYETAWLSAFGDITLNGMSSIVTIDISNLVTFASSDTSVVGVAGRVASGVAVGTANLMFGTAPGVATRTVMVSNAAASVLQLVSYAFSSTSVTPAFSPVFTEFSMFTVTVEPWLSLTAEQQTADVITYAQNDDGVWTDVSSYSSLMLTSTVVNPGSHSQPNSRQQM